VEQLLSTLFDGINLMSQVFYSSVFFSGLTAGSTLDRYLVLDSLQRLTQGQEGLTHVYRTATEGIQTLVNGRVPIGEPNLVDALTRYEDALGASLQSTEGRGIVDDYRRYRTLIQPRTTQTSTWAPRLFISEREVLAPSISVSQGVSAVSTFLGDLQTNPLPETEWPSIGFYEDCQPIFLSSEREQVEAFLNEKSAVFFGFPILLNDLLAAFAVDLPGYRLSHLELEFIGQSYFDIRGTIKPCSGGPEAAVFRRSIPARPNSNQHWIARSHGIAIADQALQRQGLGRLLTQRFLAFLHRLGVDGLDFNVSKAGTFVFPRLGFDFAHTGARNRVKIQFREYLKEKFPFRERDDDDRWAKIEHAWEVADYQLSNGYPAGRDFLFDLGNLGAASSYPVRFWTKSDYEGWGLLFSERTPPEWNSLAPATLAALKQHHRKEMPKLLTSFIDHVGNLHEALGNWLLPVDFYLRNLGPDGLLHMMSEEEVDDLHEQFVHTARLLEWMSSQELRATPLGKAFWTTLSADARSMMPRIVSAARETLAIEIAIQEP